MKLYYEAAKAETITPDEVNIQTLKIILDTLQKMALQAGKKVELTALGVGAETIGDKTYVAIGFRVNVQ